MRRPVDAPRSDFYMQAEVFAALVSIDMVGIGVRAGCRSTAQTACVSLSFCLCILTPS